MKKIISILILAVIILPLQVKAGEDYLFSSFESSPSAEEIKLIKDPKTRYCEQVYLEAMRRRDFTNLEILRCKEIFKIKIKAEIDYKRKVMQDRYIY